MFPFSSKARRMIVAAMICAATTASAVFGRPAHSVSSSALILPPEITQVVLGTTFNSQDACQIDDPLLEPFAFPSGITHIAFRMDVDLSKVFIYSVTVPSFGSPDLSTAPPQCNRDGSYGLIIKRGDGAVLPDGIYKLAIKVNNQDNPVLTISLRIGNYKTYLPAVYKQPSSPLEVLPTNTPTNTPTSTPTSTPTNTPTSTPTNTPTSTPTNTPTNTPIETLPLDGTWQGTTSQAKPISFVISGRAIARIIIGYQIQNGVCTVNGNTTINFTPPQPISGNSFSLNIPGSTSYVINGTFTSSTAAFGTLTVNQNDLGSPSCNGSATATWTATKQ